MNIIADAWVPALDVMLGLVEWYVIILGLVVQYWAIFKITGFGSGKAVVADLVLNAFSVIGGIALIPVLGMVWQIAFGILLEHLFGQSTFVVVTWIATFAFSVAANVALQWLALKSVYKLRIGKKEIWLLVCVHSATIAIALLSNWIRYQPFEQSGQIVR